MPFSYITALLSLSLSADKKDTPTAEFWYALTMSLADSIDINQYADDVSSCRLHIYIYIYTFTPRLQATLPLDTSRCLPPSCPNDKSAFQASDSQSEHERWFGLGDSLTTLQRADFDFNGATTSNSQQQQQQQDYSSRCHFTENGRRLHPLTFR